MEGGLSSRDVGSFYDQLGVFWELVWGNGIHVGCWRDPSDDAPLAAAQDRLTVRMIDAIAVGAGRRVLDVGAGNGKPAIRLAKATGCEVVGITNSRVQVEVATRHAASEGLDGQVRFLHADGMQLPFEADSFDAVWAVESLSHMPDRSQALREIARVLRPGGALAIADMVALAPVSDEQWAFLVAELQMNSLVTLDRYREVVRAAGLEVAQAAEISASTRKTGDKVRERMDANAEALSAHYGTEFLAAMRESWSRAWAIYEDRMGYVLLTARKPPAGAGLAARS
ncbi:SAM-dependent methyltransferase [Sorangium sp. So ce131]|uniref:SAM-dependent methyltransferase n=1 Tax=Sorangium sp. So ce131 TaxID=3133282 RepID=UPI003F5F25F1